MSELIDKLERAAKGAPAQAMGFRAAQAAETKPRMLLVALAGAGGLNGLSANLKGADAVLFRLEAGAAPRVPKSLEIPWGVWRQEIDAAALAGAGADFLVFTEDSPLTAMPQPDQKTGKILQVEPSLNEGLLRAAGDLPVDAVLIAGEANGPLTWHDLMVFQRAAGLLSKPLLVAAPATLGAGELKSLWDIGVDGVVIEVSKDTPEGKIEDLNRAASGFSASPQRKRGKTAGRLPALRMETPAEHEAEEEEPDEDE